MGLYAITDVNKEIESSINNQTKEPKMVVGAIA
jgi:hypothetical protein